MSRVLNMPSYLYQHQKDLIHRVLEDTEGHWFVVKSFRQLSGKTFALENLVLAVALTRPGSISLFVEPSNNQCSKVGSETYSAVAHLDARFNGSSNILTFPNGSKIYFRSSEADTKTIRGYTVKKGGLLIVDEAGYVSEEYYNALFPIIQKNKAPLVLASTPDRMSGTFYDFYERGLANDLKIVSLNWSQYLSNFYSEEELEFYRSVYSSRRFRTEILGEFTVDGGSVFTNFDKCIGKPADKKIYLISIDWGVGGGDYTAITFWNKNKEVVDIKYFNDLTPGDQLQYLRERIREDKPEKIIVESNSIGNVYYDMLKRSVPGVAVEKFSTSNSSKCEIVDRLQAGFEHQEIVIPDDEELLRELRGFEEQTTKSGLRTYNCPPPLHDDLVMSLAIGYWKLSKKAGQYSISIV